MLNGLAPQFYKGKQTREQLQRLRYKSKENTLLFVRLMQMPVFS